MASTHGYTFYFVDGSDMLTFPITPGELTYKQGSNNKTITLIDEGDINVLKSPSLFELEFDARFPMRKYPYSREVGDFQAYFDKFESLKEDKKPFKFIVIRNTLGSGKRSWETNLKVALEDFEVQEKADEGDDVIITFKLKQYKDYGVKTIRNSYSNTNTTSTSNRHRGHKEVTSSVYTVKSGDCLWNISKAAYGTANKWKDIYSDNKSAIEADAKKHGRKSSSNGHWIYPGLKLTIKGISNASSLNVKKLW